MPRLVRAALVAGAFAGVHSGAAGAQSSCAQPDTIIVRGTVRTTPGRVVALSGLEPGRAIPDYIAFQTALRAVFASGEYDDVSIACELFGDSLAATVIDVIERPTVARVDIAGNSVVSRRNIEDRIDLLSGRAADPASIVNSVTRIDSLYQTRGFYLATVVPETTVVEPGRIALTFRVDEGRRLAIAGLEVVGAKGVPASVVAGAMKTRPEGFFWFRRGEYNDEEYAADLGDRIPALYAEKGFIDFRLESDTLIVDRERGKGFVRLTVHEGPQFRVGSFSVQGNQFFTEEQLRRYFPFGAEAAGPTLTQRLLDAARGRDYDPDAFNAAKWDEATGNVQAAYYNEGYARVSLVPIVERSLGPDSVPIVNLQWRIREGAPSIVNRVDIIGNTYTVDRCIRDMIVVLPGAVFSRDRLIRSIQGISNMGFFEPIVGPDVMTPTNENGDIDVIIRVKEKRTGNVSFGAQMGQGTGLGGFIGLDQPNLFGKCKRVALNWQFGRFINNFDVSYTDPALRQSLISGSFSLYRQQARYRIADLGQTTRIGGSLRFGFPVRGSNLTRAFVSYTGESVKYGSQGLLGTVSDCVNCFRSSVGLDLTRDTRFGLPFPVGGAMNTIGAQFNGGPLGGSANFQRYTAESRAYAPLAQFGGTQIGSMPMDLTIGLSTRMGAVFGNTGPFFFSQRFAMGGVQFGEPLRGYPEFSITPAGFLTGTGTYNAQRESFGSAYFASTLEMGLRFNSQVYANVFYDAGNVWQAPREFDPTRLFRGAGVGLSVITPLGPLGLDWAYGFDRLDEAGRRDPKWQLHFRLGQLF